MIKNLEIFIMFTAHEEMQYKHALKHPDIKYAWGANRMIHEKMRGIKSNGKNYYYYKVRKKKIAERIKNLKYQEKLEADLKRLHP